jgi:4-hydroxy-3-methylbut-2-enyl diphosphate reductase
MLSAHGSAPAVVDGATARAAVVIDAVCPLVTKVHHEVRRMSERGYDIIYVGHRGHDEAVGTLAEAPDSMTLVEPETGLGEFAANRPDRVALVAQTTLGLYEWQAVLEDARRQFPSVAVSRKSDLCYATTNRQEAVTQLASKCDLILVVGSENSSNTRALVRVAREQGVEARRIDSAGDIAPGWLEGKRTVGLTAGASAPDHLIGEVIDRLDPTAGVEFLSVTEEEEYFPLPPQLRAFVSTIQAMVEAGFTARSGGEGWLDKDRAWTATEALALVASDPDPRM